MTQIDFENANANGVAEGVRNNKYPVSKFRKTLPQFLATSAKNLILLDLGMTVAFPTLVIAALLDGKEYIQFDASMASWFGSISFICQPLGSLVSGSVLEPLGRKCSMLLVNIPHLMGWCIFCFASTTTVLFTGAVIMGLSVGFMEAPVITYVGEICEPRLRGVLTSYSGIFVTLGLVVEFLLGTMYDWRTTALISSCVPVITIIAISQVPESPMWLLSKDRIAEAEKSLCWLRGWVPASEVQNELADLIRYSNASKLVLEEKPTKTISKNGTIAKKRVVTTIEPIAYANPIRLDDDEGTAPTDRTAEIENGQPVEPLQMVINDRQLVNKWVETPQRKANLMELTRDMLRPQMLKPLGLVIGIFAASNGSGMPAVRPYMVKVFKELRFPVDPSIATVIISGVGFMGTLVCIVFVSFVGKRGLALTSLAGCANCLLCMSVWILFDEGSGDQSPGWWPFILFIMLSFSFGIGISPIPWIILSEIFPYRGRGFASGVAAAIAYIMGFVTSKTFLDLQKYLGLAGVFSFYGTISLLALVFVYFKLPETEGRSLEDIENSLHEPKKKDIKQIN